MCNPPWTKLPVLYVCLRGSVYIRTVVATLPAAVVGQARQLDNSALQIAPRGADAAGAWQRSHCANSSSILAPAPGRPMELYCTYCDVTSWSATAGRGRARRGAAAARAWAGCIGATGRAQARAESQGVLEPACLGRLAVAIAAS